MEKGKFHQLSSALFIGSILGLVQTIFLILAAKPLLNFMGVKSDSPMLQPAQARATRSRVLQLGLVLGFVLALILGVGLQLGAKLFTNDVNVLHLISVGILLVPGGSPDPECVVVCKIAFVSAVKLTDLKKNADEQESLCLLL